MTDPHPYADSSLPSNNYPARMRSKWLCDRSWCLYIVYIFFVVMGRGGGGGTEKESLHQ